MNNKENLNKFLNDNNDKYEKMNKRETIIKIIIYNIKEEELNSYIERWKNYDNIIKNKEIININRYDKLILIEYIKNNCNKYNYLINIFTDEQYINFRSNNKIIKQKEYLNEIISEEIKDKSTNKKSSFDNSSKKAKSSSDNNKQIHINENNQNHENSNEINDNNELNLNSYSKNFKHSYNEEQLQKELPINDISDNNILDERELSPIFGYYETDINNFLKKSIYSIIINDKNEEISENEENDNKRINKIYEIVKDIDIKFDKENEENQKNVENQKILKDNFIELINCINEIKELINKEMKNKFKIRIDLHLEENNKESKGKFKNINCKYIIKNTFTNKFVPKQDEDILNNKNFINF